MRNLFILLLCLVPSVVFADVDTFEGQTGSDTFEGIDTADTIEGSTVASGGSCSTATNEVTGSDGRDVDPEQSTGISAGRTFCWPGRADCAGNMDTGYVQYLGAETGDVARLLVYERNARTPGELDPTTTDDLVDYSGSMSTTGSSGLQSASMNSGSAVSSDDAFDDSTCDTTSASTTINMDSTTAVSVGDKVSGTGIAADTYVSSVDSGTQITVSTAATADGTDVTLTFTPYNYWICIAVDDNSGSSWEAARKNVTGNETYYYDVTNRYDTPPSTLTGLGSSYTKAPLEAYATVGN